MVTLNINGSRTEIDADPDMPLLWACPGACSFLVIR